MTRPRSAGLTREREHWARGRVVAGVDEVGRGAWAGPVTVGVVALSHERRVNRLRDSKTVPSTERERIATRVRRTAIGVAVGHASNDEIDRHGMTRALRLAAGRALETLDVDPDVLLIDGKHDFLADLPSSNETIVRGDSVSASIAAASIVAKVERDRLLVEADVQHPVYAFASNKGYPSPRHREALAEHGPCELHRMSWAPIVALTTPRLFEVGG